MSVLSDPWFLAVAIPAVILVGLSKGGLGGAMGFIGVPLMALVISPVQAAAILLPILILADMVSLWTWRGNYDRGLLVSMLPACVVGICIGWMTAAMVTADMVRFIVGAVAITFVARAAWLHYRHGSAAKSRRNPIAAAFWGLVSGFTSFVAHLGGPPFQVYAVPLRLDPKVFTGTSVIFFATTNAIKLVPYFALGQFDATNLAASFALMPLAPIFTLVGAWIVRRLKPDVFYLITYLSVGAVALKLVWDAAVAFLLS
ncbi:MAG: sulfite exporter TauE/SafE family protein [Rhizobiaceae bacterium]